VRREEKLMRRSSGRRCDHELQVEQRGSRGARRCWSREARAGRRHGERGVEMERVVECGVRCAGARERARGSFGAGDGGGEGRAGARCRPSRGPAAAREAPRSHDARCCRRLALAAGTAQALLNTASALPAQPAPAPAPACSSLHPAESAAEAAAALQR
jgi:hypothetical protein